MLIRRIITLLVIILMTGNLLLAQANTERLSGEWKISSIEMKLFSQSDDKLLEAKTLSTDSAIMAVNVRVPLKAKFDGMNYMMQFNGSVESGTYHTQDSMIILKSASQPAFMQGIPYRYFFKNDTAVELIMPSSFYKDNTRNLAVRLECSCSYSKKK